MMHIGARNVLPKAEPCPGSCNAARVPLPVQVAVLGCVSCLHGTGGAMLPRAVLIDAEVFTCVLAQLSQTCSSLHQQEPSLTAASEAARVRGAAVACLSAAARASSMRRMPLQEHTSSLLRASAVDHATAHAESALLSMSHLSRSSAVLCGDEGVVDEAALRAKVCTLVQVRGPPKSSPRQNASNAYSAYPATSQPL